MSRVIEPSEDLVNRLEQILTSKYVSTELFERIKNTLDCIPYDIEQEQLALAVIMPSSAKEISEILQLANEKKCPFL